MATAIALIFIAGRAAAEETASVVAPYAWIVAPAGAIIAIVFAFVLQGGGRMFGESPSAVVEVSELVKAGTRAYAKRHYLTVTAAFLAVTIGVVVLSYSLEMVPVISIAAFVTGGLLAGLAGWYGMTIAAKASERTVSAARKSLVGAFEAAFQSAAGGGFFAVGLGLAGLSGWFAGLCWLAPKLNKSYTLSETTIVMLAFVLGAGLVALLNRAGGGIFSAAANAGDKTGAGFTGDDSRNAAALAGNIGDVLGRGAEVLGAFCGPVAAAAALGISAARPEAALSWVVVPMLIAGGGILASIAGVYLVRPDEKAGQKELKSALSMGIWTAAGLTLVVSYVAVRVILPDDEWLFWPVVVGVVAAVVAGQSMVRYTSQDYAPTRAVASLTGIGTGPGVIQGMSAGMMSTWIPGAAVAAGMLTAYSAAGGFTTPALGFYGLGLSAVAMTATLGIAACPETLKGIADSAGSTSEISRQEAHVHKRTDALAGLGSEAAMTGKGFVISSAALMGFALLQAVIEQVRSGIGSLAREVSMDKLISEGQKGVEIGRGLLARVVETTDAAGKTLREAAAFMKTGNDWTNVRELKLADFAACFDISMFSPQVMTGLFAGALVVAVFCALAMSAVGRTGGKLAEEIRRQVRENPALAEGRKGVHADYARCIMLASAGARREMLAPVILTVAVPPVAGLLLGVGGMAGFVVGSVLAGFIGSVAFTVSGTAWENAKAYTSAGEAGEKGSVEGKSLAAGNVIGSPLRDALGPSLSIMIMLMSIESVVIAGAIVKYAPTIGGWLYMGG
jgi:K(+)-stimulated pyrophosphate-energized sodium pump